LHQFFGILWFKKLGNAGKTKKNFDLSTGISFNFWAKQTLDQNKDLESRIWNPDMH